MKKVLLLVVILSSLFVSCGGDDEVSACDFGSTKCMDNAGYNCVDGNTWVFIMDCDDYNKVCMMKERMGTPVASCVDE